MINVGQTLYKKSDKSLIVILRIEKDPQNGGWMYYVKNERGHKSFIKIKNHSEYKQLYDSSGAVRRGRHNYGYYQGDRDRYSDREINVDLNLKPYIPKKPVMPKRKSMYLNSSINARLRRREMQTSRR